MKFLRKYFVIGSVCVITILFLTTSISTCISKEFLTIKILNDDSDVQGLSNSIYNIWPMFHHNRLNTGYAKGMGAIEDPDENGLLTLEMMY